MEYRVEHVTRYRYTEQVTLCHNRAHLTPRQDGGQRLVTHDLSVRPEPTHMERFVDGFGNAVHYFELHEPHDELVITARFRVVRQTPADRGLAGETPPWEQVGVDREGGLAPVGFERVFAHDSPLVRRNAALAALALPSFTPGRPILDAARAFNVWIHQNFRYQPGATTVATPLESVLSARAGVCQDFAHVAVGALRSLGLCARYVSGYLETRPPPGAGAVAGCRCLPCLVLPVRAHPGLGGFRSHQRCHAGQRPPGAGGGTGLCRCPPGERGGHRRA
ncbi:MAG: transglutaminase family protein [Magnetococcus sp. WYHC-3]